MKNFIPEEKVQEILERVSIEQIVSRYVSLKQQGQNYIGLCPFHSEKTPSFSVNPSKGLFYCFGCGAGGNVFTFLMKAENYTFVEAAEFLASQAGILLTDNKLIKKVDKEKNFLIEINSLAQKYYHYMLMESSKGKKALEYLKNRGISSDIIMEFGIGYSLDDWDSLISFMKKRNVPPSELEKVGLISPSTGNNSGYYDRFRGRIIFPIYNLNGLIIGFGGRIIDDTIKAPKYLNSPETKIFQKSKLLYGMNIARDEVRRKDLVILVEGYMDVIAAHQKGIKNTVASLGTAFTAEQARMLKRYTDNVVIAYDADEAGQEAALRGLSVLHENGCKVKILTLPDKSDPDDYIRKHGPERFVHCIKNDAVHLLEYKLRIAAQKNNLDTIEGKKKVLDFIIRDLTEIDSLVEREYYIRLISSKLGVTEQVIAAEIGKYSKSLQNIGANRDKKATLRNNSKEKYLLGNSIQYRVERFIVRYIMENPQKIDWFQEVVGLHLFQISKFRLIIRSLIKYIETNKVSDGFNFKAFILTLPEELQSFLPEILNTSEDTYSINDCVYIIKNNWYKTQIESLKKEISAAEECEQREVVDSLVLNLIELQREWKK
ncbi:DNA primase [Desulfitibacter alkalitolerans]|uniref:DNA primase n=1 Tax=Desulfitibacter alkalitolerans TaxID=264641 RepID=UPI000688FB90|nr:DNA primase [Desulfitibacter alkalitolerans]